MLTSIDKYLPVGTFSALDMMMNKKIKIFKEKTYEICYFFLFSTLE
jgi:hypothetical protein